MSTEDLENYETEMELQLYREWDIYRPARFAKSVKVITFKDVNVEELAKSELEVPQS